MDTRDDLLVKAAQLEEHSHNPRLFLSVRLRGAHEAIACLRAVIGQLEEEIEGWHVFDEASVLDPTTGRPYGPGPLWAGTEPMDYPDPRCVCGAIWQENGTQAGCCGRREAGA